MLAKRRKNIRILGEFERWNGLAILLDFLSGLVGGAPIGNGCHHDRDIGG